MIDRAIICCCLMMIGYFSGNAQKRLVEKDLGSNWSDVDFNEITNDGALIAYTIHSQSADSLVLQFTNSNKRVVIPGVNSCNFTQDNRKAVYRRADSIYVVDLNEPANVQFITGTSDHRLLKYGRNEDLLLYRLGMSPGQLFIRNIESGKEQSFASVEEYWVNTEGNILIFETTTAETDHTAYELHWLDIGSERSRKIWEGGRIGQLLIDSDSGRCVFNVPKVKDTSFSTIWIYRNGDLSARKVLDDREKGIPTSMSIVDIVGFSSINNRIMFNLKEPKSNTTARTGLSVDVWSYKDAKLQSQQLHELHTGHGYLNYIATVNLKDGSIVRLEYENERLLTELYSDMKRNFVLVAKYGMGDVSGEWNWNKDGRISIYLVSLSSGHRSLISQKVSPALASSYVLSYNGNYVYYYDQELGNYCSYRITDGRRINLTAGINGQWTSDQYADEPDSSYGIYQIAGFIKNSDALLVYGRHDIFKLDPTGRTRVVRLTDGQGRDKDLVFRFQQMYQAQIVDSNENILLSVFDRSEKKQGLIRLPFDSMELSTRVHLEAFSWQSILPVKARDTNLYIVGRMTAEQSMNLFATPDFSHYKRLSNVFPEREFNWLSTELVTWKTFDGILNQGILYKPEDFDPHKKYPVVFFYYERLSDNLHAFIKPAPSNGALNIPFFVSHGYLVFTPDIHYKVGWPGRSAYNAIVSGAMYLARRSYIDSNRMGLQGISFGGFETNYVITHSHLFAAAMSASGMTDFISAYGSIIGDGRSRQRQYELYRDRIGATLWQRPDLYIENSPIFRADKVTTPLLMMANSKDGDVPVQQGIEFFTALRRLGKKVWMLQYDGEGHGLDSQPAQDDLTERMFQFFNYYLKSEPAPQWMTAGIPALLKGIDTGLELDTSGAKP